MEKIPSLPLCQAQLHFQPHFISNMFLFSASLLHSSHLSPCLVTTSVLTQFPQCGNKWCSSWDQDAGVSLCHYFLLILFCSGLGLLWAAVPLGMSTLP